MEKPISSLQVRPKIQEWEALEVRGNVGGEWHIPVCPLRVRKSAMQEFSLLRSVLLKDLNCLREEVMVHIWLMRTFENWAPPPPTPTPTHTHSSGPQRLQTVHLWTALLSSGNSALESPGMIPLALEPDALLRPSTLCGGRSSVSILQYPEER